MPLILVLEQTVTTCSLFTVSVMIFCICLIVQPVILFPGRRVLVCLALPHAQLFHTFYNVEYNILLSSHRLLGLAGHNRPCFFVPNFQCCENRMSFQASAGHTIIVTTIKQNITHDYNQFYYI